MDRWIGGWRDEQIDKWMFGGRRMDEWRDGQMNGWVRDEQMDGGGMDG